MDCLLQCGRICCEKDAIDSISDEKWKKIKEKSKQWQNLDKFGSVFVDINWDAGTKGKFMHNSCYISLSSERKLAQAIVRSEKHNIDLNQENTCLDPPEPKRTRLSTGIVQCKDVCIWCMKPADTRHKDRKSKLYRIEKTSRWNTFKRHVHFLKDEDMKQRISCFIDSTTDPFACDILYHSSCWSTYALLKDNDNVQDKVSLEEVRSKFFKHVDEVIFKEREIRSLQSLLNDYKCIVSDYGYSVGDIRSSYLKEILIHEYGMQVGFHERLQKNQSDLVYDVSGKRLLYLSLTLG